MCAINQRVTFPTAGALRGAAVARIADSDPRPDYLVALKFWESDCGLADGLRADGWTLTKLYESPAPLGTSSQNIYEVYALTKQH